MSREHQEIISGGDNTGMGVPGQDGGRPRQDTGQMTQLLTESAELPPWQNQYNLVTGTQTAESLYKVLMGLGVTDPKTFFDQLKCDITNGENNQSILGNMLEMLNDAIKLLAQEG